MYPGRTDVAFMIWRERTSFLLRRILIDGAATYPKRIALVLFFYESAAQNYGSGHCWAPTAPTAALVICSTTRAPKSHDLPQEKSL